MCFAFSFPSLCLQRKPKNAVLVDIAYPMRSLRSLIRDIRFSSMERYRVGECPPAIMGFIQEWFGFNGWNELSTRGNIFATIAYRVFFVFGLAAAIIVYSYASGGEDPSLFYIVLVGFLWFLVFQFIVNLIFVNGSR